jgi:hypothetical protein
MSQLMAVLAASSLAAVGCLVACSGTDVSPDPGGDSGATDATVDRRVSDAGRDTGNPGDGGVDAEPPTDAGLNATSAQIAAVRNAATATDGGADASAVNLPIDNATVTYVRPAVGTDPAGFFVQGERTGPAIFVAIDPGTLTPAPVAGDEVSFRATSVANVANQRQVLAVSGFTRVAQGRNVAALVQDISSAADVVTALDNYESEYVKITGTAATVFSGAGAGSTSAQLTTAGITVASANLRARLPVDLQDTLDLDVGCSFSLTGPMWRFTTAAQPSGFVAADVSAVSCRAPKVASANASDLTTVKVQFDRRIAPASLLANGSQFTIPGLTVSAATLSGPREVTLTTTAQTPASSYTMTVATSLMDTYSKTLDAAARTATFLGFTTPATLRINELNPLITGSADLIELRATGAGNIAGFTLEENLVNNKVVIATLPSITVAVDDIILVHLDATGVTNESATKADCVGAPCVATAWDVRGVAALAGNARVLALRGPDRALKDGVSYYSSSLTPSGTWYVEVNALNAAMMWSDCAGMACAANANAQAISVNFLNTSTTRAGNSIRRNANDTNTAADWSVGPSSWGAPNP